MLPRDQLVMYSNPPGALLLLLLLPPSAPDNKNAERAMKMLLNFRVMPALRAWVEATQDGLELKKKLRKAATILRNREMKSSFNAWVDKVRRRRVGGWKVFLVHLQDPLPPFLDMDCDPRVYWPLLSAASELCGLRGFPSPTR